MEYPTMESGSLFVPGIKRCVRDKRISKTAKLNVSLASKIKTKILNNSSIFKISLKHNNRALAQALSREKENSRRITTEKMLLQKEVEKLNFENTFLRLKLNNLNKKLIDIEALVSNNLITAIEMSTLSEFHQNSLLLPTSKKKRSSKQCKLIHPFARVPLTSNDDDDDDDDDNDIKKKMQHDINVISRTSSDTSSSVSTRQILSTQHNLELSFLKENNKNMDGLGDSEHISSVIDRLPKENHPHSDQNLKSSLMDEMKNPQSTGDRKEKIPVSKITTRKKRLSSWESNNPPAHSPCVANVDEQQISNPELDCNNEINDINEFTVKKQKNSHCFCDSSSQPANEPATESMSQIQASDNFLLQKTVYDGDMDLTASEVSKIVTISTNTKNASNNKLNDCKTKTFRKVKYSSSGKKREKSRSKLKNADVETEEMTENELERKTIFLDGKGDTEEMGFVSSTEQPTQLYMQKKISLTNDFDPNDRGSTQYNEKKKKLHVTNEQEETYSVIQNSGKFQQETKCDMIQSSVSCNKRKASRQTIIIQKFEKGDQFLSQKDKEIIPENQENITEFQTADHTTKDNESLCDYETQNILDLKKHITDNQSTQQNELKISKKLRQKRNRKTEIISEANQINGDDTQDICGQVKGNFFPLQTQVSKETISDNLEVYSANVFQSPAISPSKSGKLCDPVAQNLLGLPKQFTDVCLVQQNKMKVNKSKQKINRKTEIISVVNQISGGVDQDVHGQEKGNFFSLQTQENKETISDNLEVYSTNMFQSPAVSTSKSGKLCDSMDQNLLGLPKQITDVCLVQQNKTKVNKSKQKINRKTEIISVVNQISGGVDQDVHGQEKGNFFSLQTQENKETISDNLEVYSINMFQSPAVSTSKNGKLCDSMDQNLLDLPKQITEVCLVQQNKMKVSKSKQKINRKTEIISEAIHQDSDKNVYCPEKESNHLLLKDTEIISQNLEDPLEFQISVLSTTNSKSLCKSQNVCEMKKQILDPQYACQNRSKIDEKLKQNLYQKAEILKISQINENIDKDMYNSERGNLFSLTQKHKNIIPKNLEDFNEIENADGFTRGNENLSDFEAVKKHVTDKTPLKQNKRKINKQRQKVSQKRKITFVMSQVHEDNIKDIHNQENCTRNLDFTINKSKQRLECQDIIGRSDMEINSNEKEKFSISNSYKRDEKHEKESLDKAMIILSKGENKAILHLKDSLQTFASESGLRHYSKEADCDPGNQMKPHKSQKRRTKTLNKSDSPFVEMVNEEECQVQTQNKMTSKSRKRKNLIRSSGSQEVMEIISDTIQGIPVESKQTNKEKSLENEEIVKLKPDFYTKMFKSLSQIYSPSVQDSSFNSAHEDSMPLSVYSKENLVLKSSQIFQANDIQEKMKGMNIEVNQRTKISGVGDRILQDLTNTNFVSNNTDKPENKSDLSTELTSRKRRCIPLCLKEPSLRDKLRR